MNTQLYPVTGIYSDANGDSHFEDVTVPMNEAGEIGWLSSGLPVKSIIFREVEPSYDYDFHNAPQRQYLVLIDGEIEIETSLGEIRRFKGGDVLLLEDTEGKGHRTKNIIPMRRKSLFITL
ncbi:hypothetical protein [uncultured Chitinophaga sp.]|uniref:hypothetical protein n=1 Tax=uncultured Chitinophaga sp. TaxID=339340 RepID=UPI0025D3BE0C|nr:hypothetical protein [uncultured Chitinophaga sp.]